MADLHFLTAVQLSEKNQEQENKLFRNARFIFIKTEKFNPSLNAANLLG